MKKYILLLAVLLVLCLGLSRAGYGGLPFEGKWNATGSSADGMESWYLTYEFRGGDYILTGYPPKEEKGSYDVVSIAKNEYLLLLHSNESTPFLVQVKLLKDGTLYMSDVQAGDGLTFGPFGE